MITPEDYSYLDLQHLFFEASALKDKESRGAYLRESCLMNASLLRGLNYMLEAADARSTRSLDPDLRPDPLGRCTCPGRFPPAR